MREGLGAFGVLDLGGYLLVDWKWYEWPMYGCDTNLLPSSPYILDVDRY